MIGKYKLKLLLFDIVFILFLSLSLLQRKEPKKDLGKPDRSARFALPTR
jgi:hypothetical protein